MDYDVMIAGAGPAGSATARDIARAGFRVLIVDKRIAVGEPAFCSGLVSPRTLEVADICDGVVLNSLRGAVVHSTSGKRLAVGGDKVHALAIDRVALDIGLAEQAQDAGADLLLGARLVSIEREGQGLKLSIATGKGRSQVTAKLLIGADGAYSRVARWMGVYQPTGAVRAIGADARLKLEDRNWVRIFIGESVAPGWFGWMIPLGDGKVRIGTGDGNHSGRKLKDLLSGLISAADGELKGIKFDRIWVKAIPLYSAIKTYGDNVLLVGDAARQVKPTSGGGIFTGLVGARHCAQVAVAALEREDFSEAFLSRYETAWKGELGVELERGLDLRRGFLALKQEEIDKVLGYLKRSSLQRFISHLGDIDFPSPLAKQLLRAAPFLRFFLHVPLRFPFPWSTPDESNTETSLAEGGIG